MTTVPTTITRLAEKTPHKGSLLAPIHAACFSKSWSALEIGLLLAPEGSFVVVAEEDKTIIGFILLRITLDECEILTFAVLPEAQGKGVGKMLLSHGLSEAESQGAGHVFLEVSSENAAAIALYTNAGFEAISTRKRYYENTHDALVMRRSV